MPTLRLGSDPALKEATPPPLSGPATAAVEVESCSKPEQCSAASPKDMVTTRDAQSPEGNISEPVTTVKEPETKEPEKAKVDIPCISETRPTVLSKLSPISPTGQTGGRKKKGNDAEVPQQAEEEDQEEEDEEEQENDSDEGSEDESEEKPKSKKARATGKGKKPPAKAKAKAKAKGKASPKPKATPKARGKAKAKAKASAGSTKGEPTEPAAAAKRPRKSEVPASSEPKSKRKAPASATTPEPTEKEKEQAEKKAKLSRKSVAYVQAYKAGLKEGLEEKEARQKGKDAYWLNLEMLLYFFNPSCG